jgi:hypothetical protein
MSQPSCYLEKIFSVKVAFKSEIHLKYRIPLVHQLAIQYHTKHFWFTNRRQTYISFSHNLDKYFSQWMRDMAFVRNEH